MATFDAVFVGSGINSLVGAALLARDGWSVCVLERNDVAGGCISTSQRSDAPGLHPRGARVLASALHGLGRVRRAQGRSRPTRRRRTSTPTCRPGRRSPTAPRRSSRARSRGTSRSSTAIAPGDGAAWERQFNAFMAQRRPRLRASLDRALVGRRPLARAQGASTSRPPRAARVRRQHARRAAATGSTSTFESEARPRGPRAVGAPHGPRPGSGDLGVHDAGDRRALQLGGMPVPERRRRPSRRRARRDRHRRRR